MQMSPLRGDPEVVEIAVHEHGGALDFASDEMKANIDIVKTAVRNTGYAICSAQEILKANRDVVLAGLSNSSNVLACAHYSLRSDPELVKLAVRADDHGLLAASDDLRDSQSFLYELWLECSESRWVSCLRHVSPRIHLELTANPYYISDYGAMFCKPAA